MPPVCGSVPATLSTRTGGLMSPSEHSCPDKEGRSSSGRRQDENKVQDQVFAIPVHTVTR